MRAALPRLRARRAGHIINITSIAGRAPGGASAVIAELDAYEALTRSTDFPQ